MRDEVPVFMALENPRERVNNDPGVLTLGLAATAFAALQDLARQGNTGKLLACIAGGAICLGIIGVFSTSFTTCSKIYVNNKMDSTIWLDKVGPFGTKVSAWGWLPNTYLKITISSYHTYTDIYGDDIGHLHWGNKGKRGNIEDSPDEGAYLNSDGILWWTCYYNYGVSSSTNISESLMSNFSYSHNIAPIYLNLTDITNNESHPFSVENSITEIPSENITASSQENKKRLKEDSLGVSFRGLRGAFYSERKRSTEERAFTASHNETSNLVLNA